MTQLSNTGIGVRCVRPSVFRVLSPGLRFVLVAVVAVMGLAGCGGTPSSPAGTGTAASAMASSTVIPSATPAISPTPAPPVSFVATGSMHAARSDATATLLKNGKVLIAGGNADHDLVSTVYASSELYDPATGKFTKTGSMTAARTDATASLLPDGRVLIVGGEGCSDPKHCTNVYAEDLENLVSAEIYDPATGKFVRTGSMVGSTPNAAAAVLMPDDRVLFVGQVAWGELYDAATGKFVRTGNVGNLGGSIIATLLPDGKVLVTGAYGAHLYDETSGKFTTISLSLPAGTPSATYKGQAVPRDAPYTATLLPDGRVLLFEGGYLATYDPATGACTDAGFISPGGEWIYPTATLLPDGTVLFEGGELKLGPDDESSGSTNAVVLYDPTSGHARMGSTQVARLDQTATLLPDGSVLIAGGEDKDGNVLASAELFKP